MKKLKLILSLLLFLTPSVCFAKVISIDQNRYNVTDILTLNDLSYDAINNTLILNNANYHSLELEIDYNLTITLIGNNVINNQTEGLACLKAGNIIINGDGTLNLNSVGDGIKALSLEVNDVTLTGNVEGTIFKFNSGTYIGVNNPKFNINNSNMMLKSNNIFDVVNGDITLNNSNIVGLNTSLLLSEETNSLNLNNSTLKVSNINDFNKNNYYVDDNSNILITLSDDFDINKFNTLDINCKGSVDNINYHNGLLEGDKYLIIGNNNNIKELEELEKIKEELDLEKDDLNERLAELERQEQLLNQQQQKLEEEKNKLNSRIEGNKELEDRLNNKELELLELNDNLNTKEEYLMKKESELENTDNQLVIKESSINALSNILTLKSNENKSLEESINREKEEIESLKRYLSLKENELKKKESRLLQNEDDLSVEEEKTNYGEVLEDDLLESVFMDNKQDTNYINKLSSMFYLFVSYVGGIVTHVFTKRKIHG
ncbi:MAG: hypothetical protein IKN63_06775 [Bacilli bacterium]|nr:hypothetical protein [Bacilli bacterium]